MTQNDIERIARTALKDLGAPSLDMRVVAVEGRPGHWRIELATGATLKIACGEGSTAQWVREQVCQQYLGS